MDEFDIKIEVFAKTDKGLKRDNNEDSFFVADLTNKNPDLLLLENGTHVLGIKGSLFIVADGIGGENAGEIASQMAVNLVYENMIGGLEEIEGFSSKRMVLLFKKIIAETNTNIFYEAKKNVDIAKMGTTFTGGYILFNRLYLAQVGDSRAYILRKDKLYQVTKDQTLVQSLIDSGRITKEEAKNRSDKSIIIQALGDKKDVNVVLSWVNLKRDDILLLCSDGLYDTISDEDICKILNSSRNLNWLCQKLIDSANENGGIDNITVILSRFFGKDLKKPKENTPIEYHTFDINDNLDVNIDVKKGDQETQKSNSGYADKTMGDTVQIILEDKKKSKEPSLEVFEGEKDAQFTKLDDKFESLKTKRKLNKKKIYFIILLIFGLLVIGFVIKNQNFKKEEIDPILLNLKAEAEKKFDLYSNAEFSLKPGYLINYISSLDSMLNYNGKNKFIKFAENKIEEVKAKNIFSLCDSLESDNAIKLYESLKVYFKTDKDFYNQIQEKINIEKTLKKADIAFKSNYITKTSEIEEKNKLQETAYYYYDSVLKDDENNKKAINGLKKIKDTLIKDAEKKVSENKLEKALNIYEKLLNEKDWKLFSIVLSEDERKNIEERINDIKKK